MRDRDEIRCHIYEAVFCGPRHSIIQRHPGTLVSRWFIFEHANIVEISTKGLCMTAKQRTSHIAMIGPNEVASSEHPILYLWPKTVGERLMV